MIEDKRALDLVRRALKRPRPRRRILDEIKRRLDGETDAQRATQYRLFLADPERYLDVFVLEPLIARGLRSITAPRKAVEIAHGSTSERASKYAEMQRAIDEAHRRDPELSYTRLSDDVARQFACSARSIRRHTQDPTK